MIRITIVILLLLSIFSCNQQPQSKTVKLMIKLNGKSFSEKQIGSMIIDLNHSKDSIGASKLLDTLIKFNGNTGFIYFERGIVENYYSHYNQAINDFKRAQSLKYSQKKCQTMILVSQSMRDGTN
jgi:hypothetical protein